MNDFVRYSGDRVRKIMGKSPGLAAALDAYANPEQVLRRTDATRGISCTRVIWSAKPGPSKGGMRVSRRGDPEALKALAIRILLKCAVNALPHGGAAGEIVFDAADPSDDDRKSAVALLIDLDRQNLASGVDILSPDLGFGEREIRLTVDHLKREAAIPVYQVNGKPADLGGVPGRKEATGIGAAHVLALVSQRLGLLTGDRRFTIQGFGHAGQGLAAELCRAGWTCVSASDSTAALYAPGGLPVADLVRHKAAGGRFTNWQSVGVKTASHADQWSWPAELLVPAFTANQLSSETAKTLPHRIVLEVANGPIQSGAEEILEARGVTVVPDLIANAGGIMASHLEWKYGVDGVAPPASSNVIHGEIRMRLGKVAEEAMAVSRQRKISLTEAAYGLGLERLVRDHGELVAQ